ncbi:DUF4097 family beta strand repeat protein [Nocardia huaxiensis]|uniref:DUF4097 family beta strand repeat protein n=1 Tax=Nocardia huaxiensis TaxID=2755382 RepID=A0A7D6ZEH0_9NOCA|nr:DUF4097 family beta strand repeat-containing protein [Nocardia huaxiensis]QLY31718.1 DUF4097 family beta strand repeat protein [Nocardia huaxiensis]
MTTFQTPAPISLTVDVLSGNVTVIASDRTDTVVEVRPADAAKKADVRAAANTTVDFADGVLTVRAAKDWRTHTPFGGNPTIEVTIQVPTGSRLQATAGVGRVLSSGELGDSTVEVSAGDVVLDRTRGAVTAKVSKGDIRIAEATRGVLRVETSMGDLEIGIHPGSTARLETNAQTGIVQNLTLPAASNGEDIVQVYARNSYGNVVIRHADAA